MPKQGKADLELPTNSGESARTHLFKPSDNSQNLQFRGLQNRCSCRCQLSNVIPDTLLRSISSKNRAGELMRKKFPEILSNDEPPPTARQVIVEIVDPTIQLPTIVDPETPAGAQQVTGAIPKLRQHTTPPIGNARLNVGHRDRSPSPDNTWVIGLEDRPTNPNADVGLDIVQEEHERRNRTINGETRWSDEFRNRSESVNQRAVPEDLQAAQRSRTPTFAARGDPILTHTN